MSSASGALPETEDLLRDLVAFPTVSADSNLPLAEYLADRFDHPDARVVLQRKGEHHANLLVRIGPETSADGADGDRPGLVLSGHMDVVPADEDGWDSPPFELTARGDDLVGRGSADMKGFLALATRAALGLMADGGARRLRAPLVLVFTCEEEIGTVGARYLVDRWNEVEPRIGPLPRAAVIGEPTELRAVRLHKGHLKMRVTARGRSAHSGYPHLGKNAIESTGRAVAALTRLRRELEAERPEAGADFPAVPYVALNMGLIRGGAAVNVVPDRCVLDLGARTLPGTDSAALARRVEAAVEAAREADDELTVETLRDSPPLALDAGAAVLRTLHESGGAAPGDDSVAFATDAGWLQRLGLDCVVWGPGSIEVAHRPNEFIPRGDLARAADPLEHLIRTFCSRETPS